MTQIRPIEPILDRWLAEGPTRVADRVVFDALDVVDATPQVRGPRWLRTRDAVTQPRRLVIAAALAIAVGGAALLALALRSSPNVSAVPSPTPSGGPAAVCCGRPFTPAFMLTGRDGWYQLGPGSPGTAFFAKGPNEPRGPNDFSLALIRPSQVLPVGGGIPQALPNDLMAWLQGRSDLVLQPPTPGHVGALPAIVVKGIVAPGVKVNAAGNVDLMCAAGPCSFELDDALGVTPLRHFEIGVVDVRGQIVVIRVDSPGSTWVPGSLELDDVLPSIEFPG